MIGPRDPASSKRHRRLLAIALSVASLAVASPARGAVAPGSTPSVDALYQQALDQYEHGDYAEAARNLREVIDEAPPGFDRDKLKRAYLYRGISLYISGDHPGAEKAFWQVLLLDPEFRPDPLFTLPTIILAFDTVRGEHAEALRNVPRVTKHRDDPPRDSLGVPLRNDPSQRSFFSAIAPVLPFGYAQYQNRQPGKALALGISEGALVLTITATYVSFQTLRKPGNHFHPDEANVARLDKTLNNAAYILLLSELVYGAFDGVYYSGPSRPKPVDPRGPRVGPGPGSAGLSLQLPF